MTPGTLQQIVDFANLLSSVLSQAGTSYPINFQDASAIQGLVAAAVLTNFGKNETLGIDTKYPFAAGSPVPPEGCTTQQATVTYQGQQFCVPNYNWDPTAGAKRYLYDFVYSDALASALKGRDAQNFAEALLAVPVFAQAPNVSKEAIASALVEALANTAAALGFDNKWTNTQVTVIDKTLPTDPALRDKAAYALLSDAWAQVMGGAPDATSLFGLLTAGRAWGNFGQINNPTIVETNNWFKLGGYDKKEGECTDGITVFDSSTSRCVFTFSNPLEGVVYTVQSVKLAPTVVEALKTGDIGKIAEALVAAGYNYPAKLTQDSWASMFLGLKTSAEKIAQEAGIANPLKTSDYMPKFSDGTETKPPPQGEKPDGGKPDGGKTDGKAGEEAEKGWSLGAKVGLGVAIAGGLGLLGWAMMGKKGTMSSSDDYQPNPMKIVATHVTPDDERLLHSGLVLSAQEIRSVARAIGQGDSPDSRINPILRDAKKFLSQPAQVRTLIEDDRGQLLRFIDLYQSEQFSGPDDEIFDIVSEGLGRISSRLKELAKTIRKMYQEGVTVFPKSIADQVEGVKPFLMDNESIYAASRLVASSYRS